MKSQHASHIMQQKVSRLIARGRLKEAIKPQLQICKSDPSNIQNWMTLASLYGQTNDFPNVLNVCKKIENLSSSNIAIYSLMGNAYAGMGQMKQAHENYSKALKINPNNPVLLNNLGNTLYLDNEYKEAAEIFEKVIGLKPDYADAYNNLGNIYKALNENEKAIKNYQTAIALNPLLSKTMLNLAHMFADRIGHPEIAEDYFRKALSLEPDNIEAKSGITNMLRFQGKLDEALVMIKQVQRDHPEETGSIAAEADIYERLGAYDKAKEIIQSAYNAGDDIHPMIVDVYLRICRKYNSCDDALEAGEELCSDLRTTPTYKKNLHFALGKLYDKVDRFDEAFKHCKAGNEAMDVPFDTAKFEERIENLMQAYRKDICHNLPEPLVDTSLPIFIVGMPRSGTSLTEQILSSHPDVAGAGELNDINDIVAGLAITLNSEKTYPYCISDMNASTIDSLANTYLDKLKSYSDSARYVTDKMPHNFLNIGFISLLFPRAKIIHCTRDPRDTCLSIYFQSFGWLHPYGTRLEWLGFYYRQYARLMAYWENELGVNIHTINYADTVAEQENTTRRLLEYCDLPWDDACLDFHKAKRVVATASYDQVRQKIYKRSSERWRNYEQHLKPLINALGEIV